MKPSQTSRPRIKTRAFNISRLALNLGRDRRSIRRVIVASGLKPTGRDSYHAPTYSAAEVEQAFAREQSRRARPGELRDQKTEQEVRKLRLANDAKMAGLVERDRVHRRMGEALGHFDLLAAVAIESGAKRMAAVAADGDVARCRQELRQILKQFRDDVSDLAHLFQGIQR